MTNDTFRLTSTAFADNSSIPADYSCKGRNAMPPLDIHGTPPGTASLALIMHDPDTPRGDYLHWSIWNIPAVVTQLRESALPDTAIQGPNGSGRTHYDGPCPPSSTHRYVFDLYALDALLALPGDANRETVMQAVNNHLLAHTALTGTFSAS